MMRMRQLLFEELERRGYILDYGRSSEQQKYLRRLVRAGILIGCDEIGNTASFMNSSYYLTWRDNRFDLTIYNDVASRTSWIVKGGPLNLGWIEKILPRVNK